MRKKKLLKRAVIFSGFVLLLLFLFQSIISSEELVRRKYPYCRDGYLPNGFDPIVRNYVTLMHFTAHDTAVVGKVLCKPTEQKRTALLPDKNSYSYSGYEKRAKEKEVAIEDLVSTMGYYQMQVQLEEVIYDDLQWEYTEKEILDVYINSHVMYVLPEIEEESRFIFFLDGRYSEGKRAWEWSNPQDCFYVSGWNRVYSYENVEALNQYSGKGVQYLSEEICRLKEERDRKQKITLRIKNFCQTGR